MFCPTEKHGRNRDFKFWWSWRKNGENEQRKRAKEKRKGRKWRKPLVFSVACLLPWLCFFKQLSWEPYYYITYFIDVGHVLLHDLPTHANFKFGFQTVTNVKQVSFITMSWQFNWDKQLLMCWHAPIGWDYKVNMLTL